MTRTFWNQVEKKLNITFTSAERRLMDELVVQEALGIKHWDLKIIVKHVLKLRETQSIKRAKEILRKAHGIGSR